MKKYTILIIAATISLFFSGCYSSPETSKAPEIRVTSGNIKITHTVGLNTWNGAKFDREDTFKVLMKDRPDLQYLKLGEKILVEFIDSSAPVKVKLDEYLLNKDGTVRYTEREIKNIPIEFKHKKAEFTLERNFATMLSSNSEDYKKGASIRGYRMTCAWGKNECEYAFIVKSDAG